jgi:hypothetical protein
MLTRLPTVSQDVLIRAAGILQGVGQDRQAVEGAVVVDGLGEGNDAWSKPARINRDQVKWLHAHNVIVLGSPMSHRDLIPYRYVRIPNPVNGKLLRTNGDIVATLWSRHAPWFLSESHANNAASSRDVPTREEFSEMPVYRIEPKDTNSDGSNAYNSLVRSP